jgi:predicted DNA-binding transcriptional regulator AlpA
MGKSSASPSAIAAAADRWPAAMDDLTAAAYLSISSRLLWRLSSTGEIPAPRRLPGARSTRWLRVDLDGYLAGLPPREAR